MALINCPECNHQVSDTANTCPNCGFNLKEQVQFVPVVTPLSKVKKTGYVGGIISALSGVGLLSLGVYTVAAGIGILFIVLGLGCVISGLAQPKKVQFGKCPYCNTELKVRINNAAFSCPICKNVGKQSSDSLETTHAYDSSKAPTLQK